jgi:hypothetical protein
MKEKIVCVWLGSFKDKDEFYGKYLDINYRQSPSTSTFGKDAGLGRYDEDFIESWFFENLSLDNLSKNREILLDSEYFFDALLQELSQKDLNYRNTITFLFGMGGHNTINKQLFEYKGMQTADKAIEFVFSKKYQC